MGLVSVGLVDIIGKPQDIMFSLLPLAYSVRSSIIHIKQCIRLITAPKIHPPQKGKSHAKQTQAIQCVS